MVERYGVLKLAVLLIVYFSGSSEGGSYVGEFNCNAADGKFLISSDTWKSSTSDAASALCKHNLHGSALPPSTQCFLDYLAHIEQRLGRSVSVYLTSGCHPSTSMCDGTSTIICQHQNSAAAPGNTKCHKTLVLTNGTVLYPSGTVFPASAYYLCNPGHERLGGSQTQCLTSGKWKSTTPPICRAYTCSFSIPNGVQSTTGPVYTISCNTGYHLSGSTPTVTCTGTNTHTDLPTCMANMCSFSIPNGLRSTTGPVNTITCNT
eukprot:scpid97826/ scgid33427/ 